MDEGMLKFFLYQSTLSFPTYLPTPESDDSTAKGTSILPSAFEYACAFGVIEKSQSPFRFTQLFSLTNCGLGYSGSGFAEFTSFDHCVEILPSTGAHDFV